MSTVPDDVVDAVVQDANQGLDIGYLFDIGKAAVAYRRAELEAMRARDGLHLLHRLSSPELDAKRAERNRLIREYLDRHPEGVQEIERCTCLNMPRLREEHLPNCSISKGG